MGRGCIYFQEGKKKVSKGTQLTDLDIAVTLESLRVTVESMNDSILRIETDIKNLPCDDLLERIVRLEQSYKSEHNLIETNKKNIEKLFKVSREQGEAIATVIQDNKGQDKVSGIIWGLLGAIIGGGISALIYFITRG